MKFKRFVLLLLVVTLTFSFASCGKKEPAKEVTTPQIDEPAPLPPAEPVVLFNNPVTNEPIYEGEGNIRPLAIMLNNLKPATPQSGISKADIYFELPTEGETNRIMGIFYNYENAGDIGTVRSARDYYLDFCLPLDALFIHYGGSPQFYITKKKLKLDDLDGINGTVEKHLFWRDAARKKNAGWEHSVLTSGEKLKNGIKALGNRSTLKETYTPYFLFNEKDETTGTLTANTISLKFSRYITGKFEYDSSTGLYKRFQYDKPHVDFVTNEQLTVKNVITLYMSVERISGDEAGRIKVGTTGSGKGIYASNGWAQNITWSKKDRNSPLKLYDEQGNELKLNSGKTWFMISNTNGEIK